MSAQIWPYSPRSELIESLEWFTDVFQAKAEEQRIALRDAPRRIFNIDHHLTEYEYSGARALIRGAQGADGFLIPDWAQSTLVGAVSSGSSVSVTADLSQVDMGDAALLWQSIDLYEQVAITDDSNGVVLATVVNNYSNARLLPLWLAHCPGGLTASRRAGGIIQGSISMAVYENTYLGASTYTQYRSLDVIPTCPVIAGDSFAEPLRWATSISDNQQSIPKYLRSRDYPDQRYQMRWHEFTQAGLWEVRQWLHSRRGRQKAFWLSSRGEDFELAVAISGTTITIYSPPGVSDLGRTTFDIDVTTTSAVSNYRKVSAVVAGTPVGGRSTLDLTIDSSLVVGLASIDRISLLRCSRFEADRIELLHRANGGTAIQVPCVEIPEP